MSAFAAWRELGEASGPDQTLGTQQPMSKRAESGPFLRLISAPRNPLISLAAVSGAKILNFALSALSSIRRRRHDFPPQLFSGSSSNESAVDDKFRTGDEARFIGCEEQRQLCDFVGVSGAP
jgi:hypothetical protein